MLGRQFGRGDIRQIVSDHAGRHAIFVQLIFGIAIGLVASSLLGTTGSVQRPFLAAQLAYAFPTAIALTALVAYALCGGWQSLLSPMAMVLAGFLVFLSAAPLLSPSNSWGADIYASPGRFSPLVALYCAGLLLFLFGDQVARKLRPPSICGRFLSFELNLNKLWHWWLVLAVFTACFLVITARLMGFAPATFFYKNPYAGLGGIDPHPQSRLLWQSLRPLLHALAVLSAVVALQSRRPMRRLLSGLVAGVCIFLIFTT